MIFWPWLLPGFWHNQLMDILPYMWNLTLYDLCRPYLYLCTAAGHCIGHCPDQPCKTMTQCRILYIQENCYNQNLHEIQNYKKKTTESAHNHMCVLHCYHIPNTVTRVIPTTGFCYMVYHNHLLVELHIPFI